MGRAPCCEKMGLKRGPWTPEEDQVLVSFIQRFGHGNWRALPKQAGLLRCGKSCRLRWTNYLRPDIKRGNFSIEEEETIIKLHEMLGNRWSAIAARLPGRTDNEIKNVWHTHLKKRLKKNETAPETKRKSIQPRKTNNSSESEPENCQPQLVTENSSYSTVSPQQSSSDFSSDSSSIVTADNHYNGNQEEYNESSGNQSESSGDFFIDESFWTDAVVAENLRMLEDFSPAGTDMEGRFEIPLSSYSPNMDDGMDFWFDLFMQAGEQPVLPELS